MIESFLYRFGIGEVGGDPEVGRSIQASNEVAARVGLFEIHDRRLDILHIEAQSVAEKQDKEQWDGEGKVEAPEVPDQMIDLLAGDRPDIPEIHRELLHIALIACKSVVSFAVCRRSSIL